MKVLQAIRRCASLVGLSAASVLVVLVALEVGLRIAAPTENTSHWERDPILGWRGRRSLVGTIRARASTTEYAHNVDGFRDCNRRVGRTPGVARILCVGDSFTWGWGVPYDAVYTRGLERQLESDGFPVEVVNVGVGGYNTVQSVVLLLDRGFAYGADIVIHQATGNDLADNGSPSPVGTLWAHPYAELREDGGVTIKGTPVQPLTPIGWLKYQLPRHSRLGFVIRLRVCRFRDRLARRRGERWRPAAAEHDLGADHAFRLFMALVRRMERECADRDVRFILLADFPLGPDRARYWRDNCAGVEAHFIHEYLRLKEQETGLLAFIPNDGHWTEAGHAWVAEYVADVILPGT